MPTDNALPSESLQISPEMSTALQLIDYVWEHTPYPSHALKNHAMHQALTLAITSGLQFAEDDILFMMHKHRAGYWIGDGEYLYKLACTSKNKVRTANLSAARAFERWYNRKPFFWKGKRLAVTCDFLWKQQRVTVTSFQDHKRTLTACQYHPYPDHRKIAARLTLSHKQLRDAQREGGGA